MGHEHEWARPKNPKSVYYSRFCTICGLVNYPNRNGKQHPLVTTKTPTLRTQQRLTVIKKLRQRDGYHCWYCKLPFVNVLSVTVDHVIPRSKGGRHNLENLRLACKVCNERKGSS